MEGGRWEERKKEREEKEDRGREEGKDGDKLASREGGHKQEACPGRTE